MSERWGGPRAPEQDFETILRRLLREASEAIPGLSPDPKQADPVVVMLLRSFAREYADMYQRIDDSVGLAYRTLVTRLLSFPHAPEPASTVLHLVTKDAGVGIPVDFQAVASEPIQLPGGRTAQARFSPLTQGTISAFEVTALVLVESNGAATLLGGPPAPGPQPSWSARARNAPALFIALDASDPTPADHAEVFLHGDALGVRTCLWSPWDVPSSTEEGGRAFSGGPSEPPFVPASAYYVHQPFEPPVFTFRSDTRRERSPYERQLVAVGGESLVSQACAVPPALGAPGAALPPARGRRHWVRIVLPSDADVRSVRGVRAHTNAVVAINREQRSSGKVNLIKTPSHSWTLPDDVTFDNLLGIDRVVDFLSGFHLEDASRPGGLDATRSYRVVEFLEKDRRRVRVDLRNRESPSPQAQIQIDYSVTLGDAANGLAPGTVSSAFTQANVFPGLQSVTNLVPTLGGRPARSADMAEDELSTVLRARGRAVVAQDYVEMARAFDPERIRSVTIGRGVVRGPRGLRSGIIVETHTLPDGFVNVLERESFRTRLTSYIQDRCSIGESVEVQLVDLPA